MTDTTLPTIRTLGETARDEHHKALEAATDALTHAKLAGDALNAAKAQVGHGKWEQWLRDEFPATARTARRYMSISRHWDTISKRTRVADSTLTGALAAIRSPKEDDEPDETPESEEESGSDSERPEEEQDSSQTDDSGPEEPADDEDPEPNPDPEPDGLTDDDGEPVPDGIAEAFGDDLDQLDAEIDLVSKLSRRIKTLEGSLAMAWNAKGSGAHAQVRQLLTILKQARPALVCRCCIGEGCDYCQGRGFICSRSADHHRKFRGGDA